MRIQILWLTLHINEEEEVAPKPVVRVKAVPEIKKLEGQINKAPVACQSLLKVSF